MRTRNVVVSAMAGGLLVALTLSLAFAQDAAPAAGGRGGAGGARGGQFNPQQMMERQLTAIKDELQVKDEDWKALQPKVEKVLTLALEVEPRMPGMGARRGGQAQGEVAQPAAPLIGVAKATQDLRTTLDNKDASADEIKAKLTALRAARETAKQELTKARQALREFLSARQEALLVLRRTLD